MSEPKKRGRKPLNKNEGIKETVKEGIEEIVKENVGNTNVPELKKRGRKPGEKVKTEEEIRAYRKKYNDMRGARRHIYKTCPICNITVMSQNFNRHILSQIHGKNQDILDLSRQLEMREDININK